MTERGLRTNVNPVDDYAGDDLKFLLSRLVVKNHIKCPHCGESHYYEGYSTSTCIHWTPVYKNGVIIYDNPNITTHHCSCLNCGEKFSYQD